MDQNIPVIPATMLTELPSNGGVGLKFVAEASMLQHGAGWKGFPAKLYLPNGIGNGQPMVRTEVERDSDGSVQAVRYPQQLGIVNLTIFND